MSYQAMQVCTGRAPKEVVKRHREDSQGVKPRDWAKIAWTFLLWAPDVSPDFSWVTPRKRKKKIHPHFTDQ